jgi:hypothetical protein
MKKPKPLAKPDFSPLVERCVSLIDLMSENDIGDHGFHEEMEPMFNLALECVYGPKGWDFINQKMGWGKYGTQ